MKLNLIKNFVLKILYKTTSDFTLLKNKNSSNRCQCNSITIFFPSVLTKRISTHFLLW